MIYNMIWYVLDMNWNIRMISFGYNIFATWMIYDMIDMYNFNIQMEIMIKMIWYERKC